MSDVLIASLQKRVDELTTETATLRAEAKSRRVKGKALAEENDNLKAQVATLTSDRDGLKAQVDAKPGELQGEVDKLRGEIRDRDHKDAFRRLAKTAGVNEAALDDAWQLSGYKPEGDQLDEAKITAAITSTLSGRDWLKAAPAPDGANGTPGASGTIPPPRGANATLPPGPGANRGGGAGSTDPDKALEAQYPNAFRIA
jgi:FtsZ-binding cell division protein ZapB